MSPIHVCVHGHFYQPPRQNPWLEAIEREPSAHPYHDWNERIAYECYAPNRAARVLDGEGRIARIVNNYERISFNFGATLLTWLEEEDPETYQAILEADRRSRERFDGHGSAMAQAYGHVILPLADARDRRTQVRWGIRDFEARFGRRPEGMWLPETAVDLESLDVLAEQGIRFTVLAPGQAARVRLEGGQWHDVRGGVDTTRPYRVSLPSGREIAVFFYHGEVARAVAFERALSDGEDFAHRLLGAAGRGERPAPLAHIATDGETYGHHHRYGEMALAYALDLLEEREGVEVTNYARYLADHELTHEARIVENSSWSCAHGVERWRSDCGCRTGGDPEWSQAWRGPLREALDRLREELDARYEAGADRLFRDPWQAREEYVEVLLDRSEEGIRRFLASQGAQDLSGDAVVRALRLMELQRHAMLMYTSCGWFFNDLSGIETLQVLRHAGRALQLAHELFDEDLEPPFLDGLEAARSNLPEMGSGADLYRSRIRPLRVELPKVAAHYAVTTLFEPMEDRSPIYCYEATREDERRYEAGSARMVLGQVRVTSSLTRAARRLSYAVLHLGDHNLVGGVRDPRGEEAYRSLMEELEAEFRRAHFPEILRILDRQFDAATYSLHSLFADEQERIVGRILEASLEDVVGVFQRVYESRAPLMRFLADLGLPQPRPFRTAGEFAVNTRLEELLASDQPDLDQMVNLVRDARESQLALDREVLAFAGEAALNRSFARLERAPDDVPRLRRVRLLARLIRSFPFEVDLWAVQNAYYRMAGATYPGMQVRARAGDDDAEEWVEHFRALGEKLRMALP